MGKPRIPSLIVILKPAVIIFLRLAKRFKFFLLRKTGSNQSDESASGRPHPNALNCRVQLTKQKRDDSVFDAFTVEICGSIHAPDNLPRADYTVVRILLADVTDGIHKAKPVHSRVKHWQIQDSPTFCYNADLGKLPNRDTTLSDWISVGQINLDWLTFPRRGKRKLQFSTSILSRDSGEEFACAICYFTYENTAFGYIDPPQEDIQRTRTLAVALAFAVSAADKKLYNCEVNLIKNWARRNIDFSQTSNKAKRKLEKALNKAVGFFRGGNQLNTYKICKEIVEIAPIAARYDILDLCLHVAQANGVATVEELALLKKFASWLEIDTNRFHAMMEKILPANMHEAEDIEVTLGVTSDMSKDETRQHLNKEYRKWNARVTNFDPEIQTQADHMLKLITQARSEYIG
jgi:tellurite resistance protein